MSGIDCENPDHERCENCGGCVPCGCICHLVPEPSLGGHVWPNDVGENERCTLCDLPSSGYTDQECPGVHTEWDGGDPAQPVRELVELEMGLREYQGEVECPKCGSGTVQVIFHPVLISAFGDEPYACQEWIMQGLLTPNTGQHLCMRCLRCRYGWPTKTRDA